MSTTAYYQHGSRTPRELQKIVNDLIEKAGDDPELAADIRAHGIDPSTLSVGAIEVRPAGSGLDPTIVTLIVTFLAPPALDVWKHVLLPRIRRRWGVDIVGKELTSGAGDNVAQ